MVFVDGDHSYSGVKSDLLNVSNILAPGTPVLCHDWPRPEEDESVDLQTISAPPTSAEVTASNMWIGVQKACNEWVQSGWAEFAGAFGCSALFVTTERCISVPSKISTIEFENCRNYLRETYLTYALEHLRKEQDELVSRGQGTSIT